MDSIVKSWSARNLIAFLGLLQWSLRTLMSNIQSFGSTSWCSLSFVFPHAFLPSSFSGGRLAQITSPWLPSLHLNISPSFYYTWLGSCVPICKREHHRIFIWLFLENTPLSLTVPMKRFPLRGTDWFRHARLLVEASSINCVVPFNYFLFCNSTLQKQCWLLSFVMDSIYSLPHSIKSSKCKWFWLHLLWLIGHPPCSSSLPHPHDLWAGVHLAAVRSPTGNGLPPPGASCPGCNKQSLSSVLLWCTTTHTLTIVSEGQLFIIFRLVKIVQLLFYLVLV